jgi:G3E family GTPase
MQRLAELNATAPRLSAEHGWVDPGGLFASGPYDPTCKSIDVHARLGEGAHHHGPHNADVHTYTIVRDAPIHAVTLTLLLETLAEHCGADLLRLKGIVDVMESPDRPAVIHGVQHVFHAPAWLPRWPSDDRRSRIVVITRGIPRRWIETLLDALDAEVAAVTDAVTAP